jgi:hypothetical protein
MQEELEELEDEVQDRGVAFMNRDIRLRFMSSSSTRRLHFPRQSRMLTLPWTSTSLRSFSTS